MIMSNQITCAKEGTAGGCGKRRHLSSCAGIVRCHITTQILQLSFIYILLLCDDDVGLHCVLLQINYVK